MRWHLTLQDINLVMVRVPGRMSAFNLVVVGGQPTLLGAAHQNGSCSQDTG